MLIFVGSRAQHCCRRLEAIGMLLILRIYAVEGELMDILSVFDNKNTAHSLGSLDPIEAAELKALLIERGGRLYFRCPVRHKEIVAKPEEAVRQLLILRLKRLYGYPLSRIAVEYPITFGRDTSK